MCRVSCVRMIPLWHCTACSSMNACCSGSNAPCGLSTPGVTICPLLTSTVAGRPFTCSVCLMAVSRGHPIGRSHELGADGLLDAGGNDAIDLAHRGSIDRPARNLTHGVELIWPARAP